MTDLFTILHEDADLLVVCKPAGLVSHPTKTDARSSLIGRVRLYLGSESQPRMVNRLDRETSGVISVAKSLEAARELGAVWETRAVLKSYLAIVHGHPLADRITIDAPLARDESSPVAIKDAVRAGGAPARTEAQVLRRFDHDGRAFALIRAEPFTGRKHQIRIHLQHSGHPIVGDKIYGGDERIYLDFVTGRLSDEQRTRLILSHHALHAAELAFRWRDRDWKFRCEPEPWFREFAGLE